MSPQRTVGELRRRGRSELLDELGSIFADRGFARTPIGELARLLRCSRSTLYRVAPTHDELVLAVLDHVFSRIRRSADGAAAATQGAGAKVQTWALTIIEEAGALTPQLRADIAAWDPARSALETELRAMLADFALLFEAAIEASEVRPANPVFTFEWLQGACSLANDPAFLESAGLTYGDALEEIRRAFFSGFVVRDRAGVGSAV